MNIFIHSPLDNGDKYCRLLDCLPGSAEESTVSVSNFDLLVHLDHFHHGLASLDGVDRLVIGAAPMARKHKMDRAFKLQSPRISISGFLNQLHYVRRGYRGRVQGKFL
jgi:hypothetical protein